MKNQTIDLSVPAMSCENCVNNIKATVSALEGVEAVTPDLSTKRVAVSFDVAKVTERQIATALGKLGFSSTRV
jgi:copper chaperone